MDEELKEGRFFITTRGDGFQKMRVQNRRYPGMEYKVFHAFIAKT